MTYNDLTDDMVSLMSDIIRIYDKEGEFPDDLLSDLDNLIRAYYMERDG